MKDRTTRLVITEKSTSNKVFDINLIDYLAMTNMEDKKIGIQNILIAKVIIILFFFLWFMASAMKIVINGWTVFADRRRFLKKELDRGGELEGAGLLST